MKVEPSTGVNRPLDKAIVVYESGGMEETAGLPNVTRLVCSLRSAGFSSVVVYAGDHQEEVSASLREKVGEEEVDIIAQAFGERGLGEPPPMWEEDNPLYLGVKTSVVLDPVFLRDLKDGWARGELGEGFSVKGALWVERWREGASKEVGEDRFGGTFHLVDSAKERRKAKWKLLVACRKPMNIDGMVCRAIGRPLSSRISKVLVELPVSPNAVTAASLLIGLAGASLVALGGYWMMVSGAALVFFSWVLDNCDGEIARVKHKGSRWGAWFDIYADFITNIAFIVGMSLGLYRGGGEPTMLYLGAYVVLAQTLYNGVVFRHIHRLGVPDEFLFTWWFDRPGDEGVGEEERAEEQRLDHESPAKGSFVGKSFSYIKYLGRRDFFIFAYLIAASLSILDWALWATAVGSTYSLVLTIVHLVITKGDPIER